MKKIVIVLALFCAVLACHAQEIYSKIDTQTLLNIMREEGYSVRSDEDGDIIWKKDGVTSLISFDGKKEQTRIYYRCSYTLSSDKDKIVNAIVLSNTFNRKKFFGKSFVREDSDEKFSVELNLPLSFRHGITKDRITDHLRTCQSVFSDWKKEVVDEI